MGRNKIKGKGIHDLKSQCFMYVGKLALIHVLLLDENVFKYFIMKITISFKKIWKLEKRRTVLLF